MNSFWVVERLENGRSVGYWDGGSSRSFVPEIDKAVQFVRQQDAFWASKGWHWNDTKITEHITLGATAEHIAVVKYSGGGKSVVICSTPTEAHAAVSTFFAQPAHGERELDSFGRDLREQNLAMMIRRMAARLKSLDHGASLGGEGFELLKRMGLAGRPIRMTTPAAGTGGR